MQALINLSDGAESGLSTLTVCFLSMQTSTGKKIGTVEPLLYDPPQNHIGVVV